MILIIISSRCLTQVVVRGRQFIHDTDSSTVYMVYIILHVYTDSIVYGLYNTALYRYYGLY